MPTCGNCEEFSGRAGEVIEHQKTCSTVTSWKKVAKLREAGQDGAARAKARRLLGVKKKGKPMTEETKEYLRRRREERAKAGVVSPSMRRR